MSTVITRENCFLKEKYYYTKHKSGLRVYISPKKLSSFYAIIGTSYGSIDNSFRKDEVSDFVTVPDGIAHFLEHKMFENEDGSDAFERFAEFGADANAYTSFDKTAYLCSCTQNFDKSLEALLDMVSHPHFTEKTVEKEQGIIAQEIRMCEDNPERALLFETLRSLYSQNNVKIEVAGTVSSIAKITPALLYSCYNTFYNLNNMVLCVCGDVTTDEILAVCDRMLKLAEPFTAESVYPDEPEDIVRPAFVRALNVARPLFAIGIKDSRISRDGNERMKKNAALAVLSDVILGKCSEFYNELYESGLISASFGTMIEHTKNFSFAVISGESDNPEAVYESFKSYIKKIKADGISRDDFERCQKSLYAEIIKNFDSTDAIANYMLDFALDDGDLLLYPDIVKSVSYEFASDLIDEYFDESKFTFTKIIPN